VSESTMGSYGAAKAYAAVVGAVLVAVGLLGFLPNPIVSSAPDALFATNAAHNAVHVGTGLIALYVAFGLRGESQANGVSAFGALYAAIFVLALVDPRLFGLFGDAPANNADHVLHAALAVSALAVGYVARGRTERVAST
jgi:hypothetical protein